MTDDLVIAALLCELVGVALLAKSLSFGDVDQYVAGTENEYGRSLAYRDLARARDMTEAGLGLGLVFVGVVGQILYVLDWFDIGRWAWLALGAVLVGAGVV